MYYIYVLRNKLSGRLYTGFTSDLRKRLISHYNRESKYTSSSGPYELVYYEACVYVTDAMAREVYLKSGMGKRYLKNRIKRFLALTGQRNESV